MCYASITQVMTCLLGDTYVYNLVCSKPDHSFCNNLLCREKYRYSLVQDFVSRGGPSLLGHYAE